MLDAYFQNPLSVCCGHFLCISGFDCVILVGCVVVEWAMFGAF